MSFKNKMVKQHKSWTASKLGMYTECPSKAMYKHIDKLPEPSSPALDRGNEIHNAAEGYVTSRQKKLHAELKMKKTKGLLDLLKKEYKQKKVRVEMELAYTKEWKPCHWLAKDVYVRFKIDVVHFLAGGVARVIDWKTGKFKPDNKDYADQLELYCLALLVSGLCTKARSALVFTDSDDVVDSGTFTMKDVPDLKKKWEKKAKPMLTDTKHPPRPGNACRWCPYSTNKGGPCEF